MIGWQPLASIALTKSWWCREILNCASRFRAVETWRAIVEGRIVGEEAIELGIVAFDAFAPGGDFNVVSRSSPTLSQHAYISLLTRTSSFFQSNVPVLVHDLKQDDHRGSEGDERFEELRRLIQVLLRIHGECRFTLLRTPDLVLEFEGHFDQIRRLGSA